MSSLGVGPKIFGSAHTEQGHVTQNFGRSQRLYINLLSQFHNRDSRVKQKQQAEFGYEAIIVIGYLFIM